ncbi:hypothetical protein QMK19_26620 [Streptomyces sp. H10-C2]|uniref:hypothetical protein n=1 Tax=unclassified Streptomyces TaxID=2593676 RepID=UPI0024BA50A3|nr:MULTISPECIES: hypothetical protein [unclassified Streptomyces]MDJ0343616.1 hypothetical protein [Streptomyces sp. PH10-H1]MDJ0373136.1 hypothetical protein [Streptomyces sp. H10-C2]
MTESTTMVVLVPDNDDFIVRFTSLDELLLTPLSGAEEHAEAGGQDVWRLPATFPARAAQGAWYRIWLAIPEAVRLWQARDRDEQPPNRQARRLFAPEGGHEHMPFYPVTVNSADLKTLRTAHAALIKALIAGDEEDDDLRELLDQLADGEEATAEKLVGLLALTLDVLTFDTADSQVLIAEVTAAGPGASVTLTRAGEAAYRRLAVHYNQLISGGNARDLQRY